VAPIQDEDRLTLASIARLEARVDAIDERLDALEASTERRIDRVLGLFETKRTADESAKHDALVAGTTKLERANEGRRERRWQVYMLILSGLISFGLGLLAMKLFGGAP